MALESWFFKRLKVLLVRIPHQQKSSTQQKEGIHAYHLIQTLCQGQSAIVELPDLNDVNFWENINTAKIWHSRHEKNKSRYYIYASKGKSAILEN